MRTLLFLFAALLFSTASNGRDLNSIESASIPPIYVPAGSFTLSEDCTELYYELTVCLNVSEINPTPTATMQIAVSPSTYIYVDFNVPVAGNDRKYVFVSNCATVRGTISFDGPVQASVLAQILYNDENVLGDGVYISDYCD